MADAGVLTVPRPHVPHGPKGVPADQADADYLREAARTVEFSRCMGSNLTATVVKLLNDCAAALTGRVSAEEVTQTGVIDTEERSVV